jgi:hypothetical protein
VVQRNIAIRVETELCQALVPLTVLPVLQIPMPQVEYATVHVPNSPLDCLKKGLGPLQIMLISTASLKMFNSISPTTRS